MIKYVAFVVLGRQSVDNNTDPSALRTDRIGDRIGDDDDRRDPLARRASALVIGRARFCLATAGTRLGDASCARRPHHTVSPPRLKPQRRSVH